MQFNVEAIKRRLADYSELEKDIQNQLERLERLSAKMYGLSSPALTGMPSSGSKSVDKLTYLVSKRDELQSSIDDKIRRRDSDRLYLQNLVNGLSKADERAVIELRYFDGEKWSDVNSIIFGTKDDFDEKEDSYLRRTHMMHGDALIQMARREYETSSRKN